MKIIHSSKGFVNKNLSSKYYKSAKELCLFKKKDIYVIDFYPYFKSYTDIPKGNLAGCDFTISLIMHFSLL